ncbi:MAG TPA: hypothetical protein VIB39_04670 [Candidatus Angelobacter sp.]|jgi:hypothetical protein
MATINGIEGMSPEQLVFELQNGARFVQYQFCISAGIITLKEFSNVYFLRAGRGESVRALRWTLLSLVAGWWGIPWGPIYTIQSIWVNLRGGNDVTPEIATALNLPIDKSTLYK